eukprot:TRINITY_DN111451_c0_g1_i1.p1 TRINITY_DN111451_c0_g1~~TRINITY_DN111451_c0_g1_i1.p1  ORF type:complete len:234 (+),score=34.42 TRINITY_DN111451_c0_g1_i1:49-702(+)
MAPQRRRDSSALVLLCAVGCVGAYWSLLGARSSAAFFVSAHLPTHQTARDASRVVRRNKAVRERGIQRRRQLAKQDLKMITWEGGRISQTYKTLLGVEEDDTPFNVKQATSTTKTVQFDKWPFGVARWQPGKNFQGAMVKSLENAPFVTDPRRQAKELGVKPGMVVKAINNKEVLAEDFRTIMNMLADPALATAKSLHTVELPMSVTFAEMPETATA